MITKDNLESYYTYSEGHKRLKREFESDIQEFRSLEEVQRWFTEMFGEDFILESVFPVGNLECWNYLVIHNKIEWTKGQALLKQGRPAGEDYLWSYQSIQVFANGDIHIVF